MKTFTLAAIRSFLIFTAVAALSVAFPASVQAVPTTYQYIGNHFTDVSGIYTTSDFVTAMVTLASPLPPNFQGKVTPTAFTFTDGVLTITNFDATVAVFIFATDGAGHIVEWSVVASSSPLGPGLRGVISSANGFRVGDEGYIDPDNEGFNSFSPGEWGGKAAVPDAGSTLSLMTLTLMVLGVAAQRFKRAAA